MVHRNSRGLDNQHHTGVSTQSPLDASQAMQKLKQTLDRPVTNRGKYKSRIKDVENISSSMDEDNLKRKKYLHFVLRVRNEFGPECAILCVISLGQTQIAHMSIQNKDKLRGLLEEMKRTICSSKQIRALVPSSWKVVSIPRPAERSQQGYCDLCFVTRTETFSTDLSPRLAQVIANGPIRAWEISNASKGTEVIRMRIPRTEREDYIMIIEVGSASDIIKELSLKSASSCTWEIPFNVQH
jgi:hypothetical protein